MTVTDAPADRPRTREAIPNVEWSDKTSGAALYTGDVTLPGMLHAAICRSPYAHARAILGISTDRAAAAPGVVATLTSDDLPERGQYIHHGGPMV